MVDDYARFWFLGSGYRKQYTFWPAYALWQRSLLVSRSAAEGVQAAVSGLAKPLFGVSVRPVLRAEVALAVRRERAGIARLWSRRPRRVGHHTRGWSSRDDGSNLSAARLAVDPNETATAFPRRPTLQSASSIAASEEGERDDYDDFNDDETDGDGEVRGFDADLRGDAGVGVGGDPGGSSYAFVPDPPVVYADDYASESDGYSSRGGHSSRGGYSSRGGGVPGGSRTPRASGIHYYGVGARGAGALGRHDEGWNDEV